MELCPSKPRGVIVSVDFGCFSPSSFSHFDCNAVRKTIKAYKNLHTNQHNEHTPRTVKTLDFLMEHDNGTLFNCNFEVYVVSL